MYAKSSMLRITFWNEIGVNAGISKLMLLSINLLLQVLVYAAKHILTVVRYKLMLPDITYYCWFWTTAKLKTVNGEHQIQALVDKKKVIIIEMSIRSDLKLDDAEELGGWSEVSYVSKREGNGYSGRVTPLFQSMMVQASEDMGEDSAAPTDSYSTPIITQPSSSKPQKNKSRRKQRKDSGPTELITEDRMQLHELMNLCTKLSDRVLALENANTSQAAKIAKLKERIKKLEKKRRSRIYKSKRLYKVGSSRRVESSEESLGAQEDAFNQGRKIAAIDQDTEVTLVNETEERNDEEILFNVDDDLKVTTAGEVVTTASIEVTTASAPTTTIDELTMAQTLIEIKAAKPKAVTTDATTVTIRPKAKGVVIEEPSETTTTKTITTAQPSSKDKGEGKMVEPKKPLKKKDQIILDEEYAFRLHAEEQVELERVQRERDA
ncbi:hypothetical protein Tco_1088385 [Tanacetum coccineum]